MTAFNVISRASMVAGQPEDISVVLANFDALATLLNGNIDNSNINVAAAIALSKLAGYPADGTKFAAGDGTWKAAGGASITTSTLAGGPPGAPANGDIWIATGVGPQSVRWMFQYDSGEATASKWKFIGGPPWATGNGYGSVALGLAQAVLSAGSIVVPRTGYYYARFRVLGRLNPIAGGSYFYIGISKNGAAIDTGDEISAQGYCPNNIPAGQALASGDFSCSTFTPQAYTAGDTLTLAGYCGSTTGAYSHYGWEFEILPLKIS